MKKISAITRRQITFHFPEIIISWCNEKGKRILPVLKIVALENRTSRRRVPIRALLFNVFTRREVYRLERETSRDAGYAVHTTNRETHESLQ